ncbi:hypothetical protein TNIN_46941 [Trichonephila inaurata madagascariensis]|uniref:Uncharacterized protein n=1 Tax=Trichonephila inaurata madagascariensis TaxID=2747483 RepID=A0A8X6MLD9_9ARAC|nr:hypothetical protein TNIN_279131 [Trichonephila inaurata madagascariensis]GFY71065.1 hypothetical protein TNIN_46941 [Trichonephila inaurata madagascariensis]
MKLTCNLSDYEAATFWLNTLPSSSVMVASKEPLVMCAIGINCRLKRGSPLSYAESEGWLHNEVEYVSFVPSRLYFCNFCVDNLLIGAHSVQKATQFVDDLKRILANGGYTIRKRASNCPLVLENLQEVLKSSVRSVEFSEDLSQKVLGLV